MQLSRPRLQFRGTLLDPFLELRIEGFDLRSCAGADAELAVEPANRTAFRSLGATLRKQGNLSEAAAIYADLEKQFPNSNSGVGPVIIPLLERMVRPVRQGLLVLAGAVGFVLLIACVNVANLLLARSARWK